MKKIKIINGQHRSTIIQDTVYFVKSIHPVTIQGEDYFWIWDSEKEGFKRIKVKEYQIINEDNAEVIDLPSKSLDELEKEITEKFNIMEDLYKAIVNYSIRSLIISGSAGTGKSSSIITMLEHQAKINGSQYTLIKGYTTPKYIYQTLKACSQEGHIVVLDDCDSVFSDFNVLNILKAATESGNKPRVIRWGTSMGPEEEKSFEFKGSIIFLTNVSFNKMTKNAVLLEHLKALASRSLYFDVSLNSNTEIFIRIKQVSKSILDSYKLTEEEQKEILDFVYENLDTFFELSLRTLPKIAELFRFNSLGWKRLVEATLFKSSNNTFQ